MHLKFRIFLGSKINFEFGEFKLQPIIVPRFLNNLLVDKLIFFLKLKSGELAN